MAIVLYREGNTAKVRDILCQIQICDEFSYLHLLEEGWYYTPEEILEAEIKKAEEAKKEKKKKEKEKKKHKQNRIKIKGKKMLMRMKTLKVIK